MENSPEGTPIPPPSIPFQVCFNAKGPAEQMRAGGLNYLVFSYLPLLSIPFLFSFFLCPFQLELSLNVTKDWNWPLLRIAVLVLPGQQYFFPNRHSAYQTDL